jgi:hypothetical protein
MSEASQREGLHCRLPWSVRYETLLGHLQHHGVKRALLDMCDREDARTIREAVKRIPERRLIRRLARALAKEY